jgi:tight adherence protein B
MTRPPGNPVMVAAAILAAAIALLVALPATSGAAPSLSAAPGAKFPERAYLLTLPQHVRLGRSQVAVTENGGPVRGLRVRPAGAARLAKLGVVLAVDSSTSMRGDAYAGAFEAARAFAGERNDRQPLALVTFASTTSVAMRFTTDRYRIDSVLGTPGEPSGGTHLYDGALRAIDLVRRSHLPGGFVVVLSDGADHGSEATAGEVVAAARSAQVRVYTIGLRSVRFDAGALEYLADATGGKYSEAESALDLGPIYTALGAELSNAYTLSYRSLAVPRTDVEVAVDVRGIGAATASYTSPRLDPEGVGTGASGGNWSSGVAIAAGVLAFGAMIGLAALLLLRRSRQSPRERIAEHIEAARPAGRPSEPEERPTGRVEASLSATQWFEDLSRDLDRAALGRSPTAVVAAALGAALLLAVVVAAVSDQALLAIPILAAAPFALRLYVGMRVEQQRRQFGDQLADHLAVVGGAMRAGHSLPAALSSVLEDAPEPTRREFGRVVADERLGAPIEEALEDLAERMANRDIEQLALLARMQREVGANAAEMLDRVVDTIRERQELRRTVRALTAQGRLSRWVLTILPIGILLFLTITNRTYVDPLYSTGLGNLLLGVAAVMVILGSLFIKRIVDFRI